MKNLNKIRIKTPSLAEFFCCAVGQCGFAIRVRTAICFQQCSCSRIGSMKQAYDATNQWLLAKPSLALAQINLTDSCLARKAKLDCEAMKSFRTKGPAVCLAQPKDRRSAGLGYTTNDL